MTRPSSVTVETLPVPGARLHYEVRGRGPLVVLVGAPMHADSFAPLAELLATDRTVLTTDPRGINRSPVDDPDRGSTPEMRADDLARLIVHVGRGPAAVLGSSGGAVSVLALAQARPEVAHTVIAHEPPLCELLPERDRLREQHEDLIATYRGGDPAGAGRKFLAMADLELPEPVFQVMFGEARSAGQVADDDFQYGHMLRATTRWRPDVTRLRAVDTRVVIGIGERSGGQLCDRASRALAGALGVEPAMFPGGHIGFAEDPRTFEPRLREVLG